MATGLWNNITVKAWNEDKIVYAMDQSQTAGGKLPNGIPAGYCFGLATVWVKHRWAFSDYDYDRTECEYWGTETLAVDIQKQYDADLGKSEDVFVPVGTGFAKAGLKLNYGRSQYTVGGSISASGLYSAIKKADGMYIIGMKGVAGAHAIAICNEGDDWWRLFDGNYGHFRMQGHVLFRDFVIDYFKSGATGYVSKYGKGWFTACAVPSWMPL